MNFVEAKNTARRLFGADKLHRGKHRCFVIRDGMVIGDGKSWLEALRSAGEMQMAKNAMADAEATRVKGLIEAFRKEHPDVDPEKPTPEQLVIFDAWMEEHDPVTVEKKSAIPEIKRDQSLPTPPRVTLK